jgi:hypothetical protein
MRSCSAPTQRRIASQSSRLKMLSKGPGSAVASDCKAPSDRAAPQAHPEVASTKPTGEPACPRFRSGVHRPFKLVLHRESQASAARGWRRRQPRSDSRSPPRRSPARPNPPAPPLRRRPARRRRSVERLPADPQHARAAALPGRIVRRARKAVSHPTSKKPQGDTRLATASDRPTQPSLTVPRRRPSIDLAGIR